MRARPMSIVAGVLLALALAWLAITWFAGRPRIEGAAFSAQEVGTASEVQRRMLADGVVTREEITAAYEADRRCLQAAGYSPGPVVIDGRQVGFEITVDYTDSRDPATADSEFLATSATCDAEHVTLVSRAWGAQQH